MEPLNPAKRPTKQVLAHALPKATRAYYRSNGGETTIDAIESKNVPNIDGAWLEALASDTEVETVDAPAAKESATINFDAGRKLVL